MSENKKSAGAIIGSIIGQIVLGVACAAGGWIACEMMPKKPAGPSAQILAMAAAAKMPPAVATTNAELRASNRATTHVAHAESVQEVDLLPQVDGYVKQICFTEGQVVTKGQTLYILDDERYQAVANQRKADLSAAEAEERRTARQYERMIKADSRGVTQLEIDNAEAAWEKAKAAVLQAKANLVVSEYDLKKAKVVAPISGQIGKTAAHVGDYVAPSKGPLARIVQIDPIRVSFPITDREYLAWRKAANTDSAPNYRTRIVLADGTTYDAEGQFDFDDNQMSTETATIMLRLKFPNAKRLLVPNSYVTVLSDLYNPPSYPSVPQTAIFDLPGKQGVGVWVVGADGVATTRPVTVGDAIEGWVPVLKGLEAGEKVVTSGVHKIQKPRPVQEAVPTPNDENAPDRERRNQE